MTVAAAAVVLLWFASAPGMAAKPTTTTVPPAPSLGVPHVVSLDVVDYTAGRSFIVSCPAGEVALSGAAILIRSNGAVNIDAPHLVSWMPLATGGQPTGYQFVVGDPPVSDHDRLFVTCATSS